MMLLALDIATQTGWAFGNPLTHVCGAGGLPVTSPKPLSGSRRVLRQGAGLGEALSSVRAQWGHFLGTQRPAWVAYEAPIMGGTAANLKTVRLINGIIGTIETLCWDLNIPAPIQMNVATIKKHFTGSGRADKAAMIAAAAARGWSVTDDNEADALALFDLVASRIQRGEYPR